MSNAWIAFVSGLAVLVIGHIIAHFVREGYVKRQLEDLEKRIEKGFEYDKLHFGHADKSEIHQHSMDERLVNSKFDLVNQRIDALGQVVNTQMDNMCDRITALADAINKNGHV